MRARTTMIVLLAAAAACSSGDGTAQSATEASAGQPTASTSGELAADATNPADGDASDTNGASEGARDLTEAELGERLLAIEDLPPGWSVIPPEDDNSSDNPLCGDDQSEGGNMRPADVPTAQVTFSQGLLGPILFHAIAATPNPSDARRYLDAVRDVLADCPPWVTVQGGAKQTNTASELSAPDFGGDDQLAIRITSENEDGSGTFDLVLVSDGRLLVITAGINLTSPRLSNELAADDFFGLTETAVSKSTG